MTDSRETVLARVRAALSDVPARESPEDVDVPRRYARAHTTASPAATLGLLAERLGDYGATVHRTDAAGLPGTIAGALRQRGAGTVVVPPGLPAGWLAETTTAAVRDDGLATDRLDRADGVLTGCAVAVAETGTIVLDTGAAQGRRVLTLVPDYHLCVVRADQVVSGVPEAVARLDPRRPLTWISGPSATSDIELNRVEGVHGPRTLDVVLVEQGSVRS